MDFWKHSKPLKQVNMVVEIIIGILNTTNYVMSVPVQVTTSHPGIFVIGQNFKSYNEKSGALLHARTLGNDLYFLFNFSAVALSVIDLNLHCNMKLIIRHGEITVQMLLFCLSLILFSNNK